MSTGEFHACALSAEGEATCWGNDDDGQSTPPKGPFVAISAGGYHTCALNAEGEATCWGRTREQQSDPPEGYFTAIDAGKKLVKLAGGAERPGDHLLLGGR